MKELNINTKNLLANIRKNIQKNIGNKFRLYIRNEKMKCFFSIMSRNITKKTIFNMFNKFLQKLVGCNIPITNEDWDNFQKKYGYSQNQVMEVENSYFTRYQNHNCEYRIFTFRDSSDEVNKYIHTEFVFSKNNKTWTRAGMDFTPNLGNLWV